MHELPRQLVHPMYYDRRIDEVLARTIEPGEALSWLMDHVRSREGADRHAHIQFRRNRRDRRLGSIQLYWGRTSPLEFKLRHGSQVRLNADSTYKAESAHLFLRTVPIDRLDQIEDELRSHLVRIGNLLDRSPKRRQSFVKREAVCHAGLMRRYGHGWRSGDPLVMIDSEAQIGYGDGSRRDADDVETREQLQLRRSETIPRKLDGLGVLAAGELVLVEVKDAQGSLDRAIVQAAAHMDRYSRLLALGNARDTIQAMIDQKTAAGLIPRCCPRLDDSPRIVPCIAAPVDPSGWPANWRRAIDSCSREIKALLRDVLLIRLDRAGSIVDLR